jgi:hypothetical protein
VVVMPRAPVVDHELFAFPGHAASVGTLVEIPTFDLQSTGRLS